MFRSSRPDVFCKKGDLRNFTKFIGKHLCQSLIFNKVAGLRLATLLKMRLWHRCFPVNFVKFRRTPFFIEHLRWLLLRVLFSCEFFQPTPLVRSASQNYVTNVLHWKEKSFTIVLLEVIEMVWMCFILAFSKEILNELSKFSTLSNGTTFL